MTPLMIVFLPLTAITAVTLVLLSWFRYKGIEGLPRIRWITPLMWILLWFFWFHCCFEDQTRFWSPLWLRTIALFFILLGFLFVMLVTDIGWSDSKNLLRRIRNPMYVGFILWLFFVPVFLQRRNCLLFTPVWLALFIVQYRLEQMAGKKAEE